MEENKINLDTVLIGCDPEAFVKDKKTGEICSAIGLIPGDKDHPHKISENGHAIQTDNVMVEFCVPPSNNSVKLFKDITYCLAFINQILPSNLETVIQASATLDKKHLKSKQAKTFGCDPDFNVYTLQPNVPPNSRGVLRSAGGHIHIGYENPDFTKNLKIVRAMDLFLGIPSILLDTDTERKKMYGKAGAYREKPYGVEYRVLSNFWIQSQETVDWAVKQTNKAVAFASEEDWLDDETSANIQLAINNQDLDLACKIAKRFDVLLTFKEQYLV